MHNTAVGLGSIRGKDRLVLVRAFPYSIGTDCYGRLMYAAKVVVTPAEDILVTAYPPEFYHKRSKYKLYLFPSNCLSDLRSFFFLYR